MRVRDLGALAVVVDAQEQPVVGNKGAAMLALLTINVNRRVSAEALAHAAWGDRVSAGAASTLLSHIWRLRQVLEPGRDTRQAATVLVNDSGGYRLVGGPSTVDSLLFEEAANEVRDLLAAGHAHAAVRRAESALALWRGQPYGIFAEADWAQPAVARLVELRAQLEERRIEGLLAADAVDAVLSDVQPLIAAAPLRESLRVLQMQALYQGGRGGEALQAYQDARRSLVDELGTEPGYELQQLHRRILNNDPSLLRRPELAKPPRRSVEVHLPMTLTPLVGRADALGRLPQLVAERRLVTVTGPAGCGKTRLAVEVARSAAPSFPDGVWFVDLTAVSDPELVVDVVVSTIGFAASPGATPLQDLGQYLQKRRMLLVVDNCEHVLSSVEEIVRTTLTDPSAAPECCVLATSRESIGIVGETIWTLDALGLPIKGTDPRTAPAVQLFLDRLAAAAPALTVDDEALARVVDICVAVDGLPLPVELAAARVHSYSLDDIAAQVADDPTRLSRVGRGPSDHRATVRSAIDWSHRLLQPDEQLAHRRLAVLPGSFTAGPAAAVVRDPTDTDTEIDVDDLLAQLVHRSLVASDGASQPGRATAFRQLATVRSHALHALSDADETRNCLDRRDAWTAALIAGRPEFGTSPEVRWYSAIDDDYETVRATLSRLLLDDPCPEGGRLASPLARYWHHRQRLVESGRWLQVGHDLLQDTDPTDALAARIWLAANLTTRGRVDLARPHLDGLDDMVRGTAPERLTEIGEALVGIALATYVREAHLLLAGLSRLLKWVVEQASNANLALLADAVDCCALLVTGRPDEAVDLATSVHRRAEAADNPMAGWVSTGPLIASALQAGRPDDGIPWIERCLALHLPYGGGTVGMFIETRANFAAQQGDYAHAARMYALARTETRRAAMVWPNRTWTHPLLAMTRESLSRADYEHAWQEGERLTPADVVASGQVASAQPSAP